VKTFMRWGALWLITLSFAGCYTQIRPPVTTQLTEPRVEWQEQDISERFEFYREHRRDHFLYAYDFGGTSFYEPFYGWPYSGWDYRQSHRLLWQYGVWSVTYDPWWGGYTPVLIAPVLTRVYPTWVHVASVDPPKPIPLRTRPRVRRVGFSGGHPSSADTRTRTVATSQASSGTQKTKESPKQAQETKEDEDNKEEKREEKRSDQRRREGMR
jgi:hypothetical protein